MIRRPPRSTQSRSSAASDVYKRQRICVVGVPRHPPDAGAVVGVGGHATLRLSLIHISEPTRLGMISYAVFCLKKKKTHKTITKRVLLEHKKKNKTQIQNKK